MRIISTPLQLRDVHSSTGYSKSDIQGFPREPANLMFLQRRGLRLSGTKAGGYFGAGLRQDVTQTRLTELLDQQIRDAHDYRIPLLVNTNFLRVSVSR